jgi:hypothetical protein
MIPVAVFVMITSHGAARVVAALASGVDRRWRIARRQPVQPAISGLFGVGVAAFIAYRTGEARLYLPA